jgi:hypothetical protein
MSDDEGGQETKHHDARSGARSLLVVSLSRFYAVPANMARALPYLNGSSQVSLRLIDWFVTNYSKKHNVVLVRKEGDVACGHFNVYLSYRSQLKAYSKQQFDPFRRRDRISYFYERDHSIETTVGQLNFFRWMLQNQVLEYVTEHAAEIEKDMVQASSATTPPSSSASSVAPEHEADADAEEEAAAPLAPPHAPPHKSGGGAAGHKQRRRTPQAQCKVTQVMTRVPGAHRIAFE